MKITKSRLPAQTKRIFTKEIGKHGSLAKTISFQRKRYENSRASRSIVDLNITLIVAISYIIYI